MQISLPYFLNQLEREILLLICKVSLHFLICCWYVWWKLRVEMTPFFSLFPPKDRGFVFFIDNHQPETIKLLCKDHVFKTDCAFFIRKQWVIVEYKSYIHASSNTTHNATVGNKYRVTSKLWASGVQRPGVFSREHLFTWISCCFLPFKCWSFCHDSTAQGSMFEGDIHLPEGNGSVELRKHRDRLKPGSCGSMASCKLAPERSVFETVASCTCLCAVRAC